jgi:hypothetical protein
MEYIKRYFCCCIYNNNKTENIENVTKELGAKELGTKELDTKELDTKVKEIEVTEKPVQVNIKIQDTKTSSDDDEDYNVVTNDDYGDIPPEKDTIKSPTSEDNNKIVFASSIKNYFKTD